MKTIAIFDATIESIYCIQIRYLSPAAHGSSLIHRKGEVAHLQYNFKALQMYPNTWFVPVVSDGFVSHSPMFVKGQFIVPFRTNTDSKLTVSQTDLLSIIQNIPE